jgi:hypothetical protein
MFLRNEFLVLTTCSLRRTETFADLVEHADAPAVGEAGDHWAVCGQHLIVNLGQHTRGGKRQE